MFYFVFKKMSYQWFVIIEFVSLILCPESHLGLKESRF